MNEVPADQQILELIVKNIVNKPEAVKVSRKVDRNGSFAFFESGS